MLKFESLGTQTTIDAFNITLLFPFNFGSSFLEGISFGCFVGRIDEEETKKRGVGRHWQDEILIKSF